MARRPVPTLALLALACAAPAGTPMAGEHCVVCSGPPATYRCAIDGEAPGTAANPAHQLHCITEIARAAKHDTCRVERNVKGPCEGELKVVSTPDAPAPAPQPRASAAPAPASAAATPDPGKPEKPATVAEVAKSTVKASGDGLEKVGHSINTAARKGWTCLKSLFKDC